MVIINMCVLLRHSIYYRKAAVNSYVAMVGVTPYSLFLKVPWVYMRLANSDFTFRKRKKAAGAEIGEQGKCWVILIPFVTR